MTKLSKGTKGNNANTVLSPVLSIQEIERTKTVKMTKNNYWLLELIYGDAAYDKTAKFQVPHNVRCGVL